MTATTPQSATEPCACQAFQIGQGITTGCSATTRRTFAQGHDQKLVSLLIRAGVEGLEVRWGSETGDEQAAAGRFGLAAKVAAGVAHGRARLVAKAAARQAKAARPVKVAKSATETPAPVPAKIKHGRWLREAEIHADGTATYIDGKGKPVRVMQGGYTLAA